MNDTFRKFKNKSEILHTINELLNQEYNLDKALQEIATSKRGKVTPKETIRRASFGSYFSSTIQQINNYVDKRNLKITKQCQTDLKRLAFKADKVLRENIVLQSQSPLDVIPFENVPVRYSYSSYGKREQRWGYGLHKMPFNEDGNSVTVANMPPLYTQSLHNHKLSEYCLILDSRTEGIYFPGGKREKIYTTSKSQILHFSATTPHTLRNPLKRYSRNITFKQAAALTDWRPISKLNKVKIIRARLAKGSVSRITAGQTHKIFTIQDRFYNYKIEIIRLDKNSVYENIHDYDQYIFVMNGRLTISHEDIKKECKKNDFIVIDKNTKYTIKTKTFSRIYTIRNT